MHAYLLTPRPMIISTHFNALSMCFLIIFKTAIQNDRRKWVLSQAQENSASVRQTANRPGEEF